MKRTEQVNLRSKKILVIISSDLYVRNYLTTDVFSEIDTSNYELFFIGESSIENKHILEEKNNFLGYFGLNPKTYHNHKELLNIYAWRYRKKSSTFPFRFLIIIMVTFFMNNSASVSCVLSISLLKSPSVIIPINLFLESTTFTAPRL